ncbi:MAG TPA: HAD hydrolase-like protein [Candidatus Methanoperedens sp.]
MNEDEYDRQLPAFLKFDWENYNWKSNADYSVIFNLNGVLIENRELNKDAWKWVLNQLRIQTVTDKELNTLMSKGSETKHIMNDILRKCNYIGNTSPSEMIVNSWSKIKRERYVKNLLDQKRDEMLGAGKLIDTLNSNHIKVGLYSMFEWKFVIKILHHIGYKQFFDAVVTPESVRPKYIVENQMSYIGLLKEVKARLNKEQNKFFLLEDSIDIVDWASGHGMKCIGFGTENYGELKRKGAICVVDDHRNLLDIFKNSQKSDKVEEKLKELDKLQIERML